MSLWELMKHYSIQFDSVQLWDIRRSIFLPLRKKAYFIQWNNPTSVYFPSEEKRFTVCQTCFLLKEKNLKNKLQCANINMEGCEGHRG